MGMSTKSKLIVLTAILASLLEIIDTAIVNVAVPHMMGNLGATIDEISWVITGYIIANAIVLPIAGWLSEQLGRKLYYTTCIGIFTAASLACGLAPNLPLLIFFRIIQGLAGGALLPTSQALIYEAFPAEQAGMASAIYGMSVLVGPTIAPTLGGYLTDEFGWRSIFNINVPIGILVAFLSYFLVDDLKVPETSKQVASERASGIEKPQSLRRPIDTWGLILLVVGIGSLQFVLERGNAEDWFDSKAIILFSILAITGIAGLIIRELKTKHPILELRHFKNGVFSNGTFLMMAMGAALYGLLFIIPIFVNTVQGLTAEQTGFLFLPGALTAALMMPFIGYRLKRGDPRKLIFIGFILLAVAFYYVSKFDSDTSTAGMFTPLLLRGIAMAFLFVPINNLVLTQFKGPAVGQVAGMLNLFRQLGGSFGIAIASTILQRSQDKNFSLLSERITQFDRPATYSIQALTNGLSSKMSQLLGLDSHGLDPIKIIYFKVKEQAFILSYQEVLVILMMGCILALIPLSLMKKPEIPKGAPVDVSAH
ncbi:MAG: transporter [Bacteriovoracaceae bacterium]|nr:transporter [Bacteriovoracaceae bacterium]